MKKIFAGNWKLHKNPQETRTFLSEFGALNLASGEREVVFFPPATSLEAAAVSTTATKIKWGSQNCHSEVKGAFTGEISAQVVKDLGGHYVLLGHSERRTIFGETDAGVAKKVKLVQSLNLTPMICIGETLPEREAGRTMHVLETQLQQGLALADKSKEMVIAYEPVWAIGTGKVATTEQVREAHLEISKILSRLSLPQSTAILYGGSVKPDNAKELLSVPHVGGFLVGGASLEVKSFQQIVES